MQDVSFKRFKLRYFILLFIVLFIVTIVVAIASGGSIIMSDIAQLILSVGLTLYLLWQIKAKNIRFNSTPLNTVLTQKGWAKYVGATIAVKFYAQLIMVFFAMGFVLLLFDFIQMLFGFMGDMTIEAVEVPVLHYVLYFIAICILAPIWEELFFRGILLRRFMIKWSAPASIIVSSLIFGLFHLNPAQVVYAGILGLMLAYAYVRTSNIIVPIILHAVANGVSFIFIVLSGGQANTTGVVESFLAIEKQELQQGMLYITIASIVATIILVIIVVKKYPNIKAIPKIQYPPVVEEVKDEAYEVDSSLQNGNA